jgi:hypothetical protein
LTRHDHDWSLDYPSCQIASDFQTVIRGIYTNPEQPAGPQPLTSVVSDFLTNKLSWVEGVGFAPEESLSTNRFVLRRSLKPKRRNGDFVVDACDRGFEGLRSTEGAMLAPELVRVLHWDDDLWFGRSRMGQIRRDLGLPLNELDKAAIRRFPGPIAWNDLFPSRWLTTEVSATR